jgi:hypothetical protein
MYINDIAFVLSATKIEMNDSITCRLRERKMNDSAACRLPGSEN